MGIFEPFRALGYITDGTPFSVQRRGLETYVTVSVGKSWQIFNLAKISLLFVGPQLERKIRAIASWRDYTYVATGQSVAVFNRAHQVSTWSAHNGKVILLFAFGKHVLSVGTDGKLLVWPAVEADPTSAAHPLGSIQLRESFTPTCIMHPDTYLNKVLIGSEEGSLQLWNVNTHKMIFEFKGWGSPVRSCVSSPALDVVGIGCGDGKIYLHNLKYNETLITFTHTTRGPVTALSFRTDGQPFLAAGGSSGVISIWDLEKKKLQTVIKDAHDGPITSLHFFANEPVLLSGGADNSLKMWIFDTSDGEGRLLRFRSGHSAPPTCIRYYGNGHHILSAGLDRSFRFFSTVQDQQSRELSQGHVKKRARKLKVKEEDVKLSPVVAFAAAEIRARDWCNVVTCHADDAVAYSWRLQNFVIGEHILRPAVEDPTPVKACAISACGNFALIGTEGGYVEKFNLQSGLNRGSYIDTALEQQCAHRGAIVGLACDATNTLLLSAGWDANIKIWNFKGREVKATISLSSPPVKIATHLGNGLLAVASDDKVLRLYDVVAVRMVRMFQGHTDRITDVCFSEDGKWLVSSSMDETVRVWDIVAAKPLDAMHVDVAVTALSLSPNMDMLATAHVNRNGIYLWANRLIYSAPDVDPDGLSGKSVVHVSMPTVSSSDGAALEMEPSEAAAGGAPAENSMVAVPRRNGSSVTGQILPSLITLAMLPKSQWQALVNLDIIKTRNKPVEPPKKPERAPFFLPTVPSVSGVPTFVPGSKAATEKTKDGKTPSSKIGVKTVSRFMNTVGEDDEFVSEFILTLRSCSDTKNYSSLMTLVREMTPSALDAELRILQVIDDEDNAEFRSRELLDIALLMDFFIHQIATNAAYEFLQALVQLFLKIHGQTVIQNSLLQQKARKLLELQGASWQRLDDKFQKIRCTVAFLCRSEL